MERWFTNLNSPGNTGAASIYIMLDELIRPARANGQRLLCLGSRKRGVFSGCYFHLTAVLTVKSTKSRKKNADLRRRPEIALRRR